MLLWLNGTENNRWDVNENYARELQELFCLGAGRGYTERDVRQLARALTGWRNDWSQGRGPHDFRYDRSFHDHGRKVVYGHRGRFDWKDAVRLVVRNRHHASFFVGKLWRAFIPTAPPHRDARALERVYLRSGRQVRPVVEAILHHPHLYDPDRRMAKPPVVQAAGMLRAVGRGIDTTAWSWMCESAGQYLFLPPNVAGWDDTRWLDTGTFRARWAMGTQICRQVQLDAAQGGSPADPDALVARAEGFWNGEPLTAATRGALRDYAARALATADQRWKRDQYPVLAENALRMLVAATPDHLTS
jgi:uncharacterized protein (DUF1800 family)